jgi:hypothetical protein
MSHLASLQEIEVAGTAQGAANRKDAFFAIYVTLGIFPGNGE